MGLNRVKWESNKLSTSRQSLNGKVGSVDQEKTTLDGDLNAQVGLSRRRTEALETTGNDHVPCSCLRIYYPTPKKIPVLLASLNTLGVFCANCQQGSLGPSGSYCISTQLQRSSVRLQTATILLSILKPNPSLFSKTCVWFPPTPKISEPRSRCSSTTERVGTHLWA